ncbi:MAG TPA: hypothetical protein VEM41_06805 [Actinomycetota bacterium]|nr:hypothetical protein [Actinomycetota bacterium]
MARLFVEGWAPDYGAPFEPVEELAPAEGSVDVTVERSDWGPLDGTDDGATRIAFVDGVRRVDARLTVDDPTVGPVPGICGTFAVGAACWDREARETTIDAARVERLAVISGRREEQLPPVALDPPYRTEAIADPDPDALVRHVHTRMRRAEGECATAMARGGWFVVADGPLNDLSPQQTIGYVKSHRVTYLPALQGETVTVLGTGQRTPLFTIAAYERYSWYVRLARPPGGHSWSGVVRCEASGALPRAEVLAMADRSAAVLPLVASQEHLDPRAPQNLVPIGALERSLRHLMGDRGLVYRAVRAAVMEEEMVP